MPVMPTLSPSATWQMTSPVAGLSVGKVFPLTAFRHSLLINTYSKPEYNRIFYQKTWLVILFLLNKLFLFLGLKKYIFCVSGNPTLPIGTGGP